MFVKPRPLTTADQNAPFGERIIPLGRSTRITVDLATKYVLNGAVQGFREHVYPREPIFAHMRFGPILTFRAGNRLHRILHIHR
jgi:hypothetical protein